MSAFFDGGLSELFEGVPVQVPVRYRGEREPELEETGAIGKISPAACAALVALRRSAAGADGQLRTYRGSEHTCPIAVTPEHRFGYLALSRTH